MRPFHYYKKLFVAIMLHDQNYDTRPSSLSGSAIPPLKLILRFAQLITTFPLSLFAWTLLRVLSIRYQVSIYILKSFRPGWGSTYLNMMEPLCRQLQYENNPRHIKILVEPGEAVSKVLVKSYEPHFTFYLDDRKKYLRLIAYLIPKSGIEKKFILKSDKSINNWHQPPSKNFVNLENKLPTDLADFGIDRENFVLFTHASKKYYEKRPESGTVSSMQHRFNNLSTFNLAIEQIFENKLKVVRVGINVDELPPALKELSIIDYTGEIRKEEGELWLYENCKFLVSATSGAYWFTRRFDRPSILMNSYMFPLGFFSTYFTTMLLKNSKSDELWSFSKTISHRSDSDYLEKSFLSRHDVEFVPNSPRTILNAVKEMLKLDDPSSSNYQMDDKELIHRYKEILNKFQVPVVEEMTLPSISFLREFQHLLE